MEASNVRMPWLHSPSADCQTAGSLGQTTFFQVHDRHLRKRLVGMPGWDILVALSFLYRHLACASRTEPLIRASEVVRMPMAEDMYPGAQAALGMPVKCHMSFEKRMFGGPIKRPGSRNRP